MTLQVQRRLTEELGPSGRALEPAGVLLLPRFRRAEWPVVRAVLLLCAEEVGDSCSVYLPAPAAPELSPEK